MGVWDHRQYRGPIILQEKWPKKINIYICGRTTGQSCSSKYVFLEPKGNTPAPFYIKWRLNRVPGLRAEANKHFTAGNAQNAVTTIHHRKTLHHILTITRQHRATHQKRRSMLTVQKLFSIPLQFPSTPQRLFLLQLRPWDQSSSSSAPFDLLTWRGQPLQNPNIATCRIG